MKRRGTIEVVTACDRRCRWCDRRIIAGTLCVRKVAWSDSAFVSYRHHACAELSGWTVSGRTS